MISSFDPDKPPIVIRRPPLRYVEPYSYKFETHTKGRWLKRQLIQVLLAEFKAYTRQYYLKAIAQSLITINHLPTTPDTILKDNDLITHRTTRVQPPILDLPIKIIQETKDLLVVQKPPGITIHTGGGFHYNTIVGRLFYQNNKRGIYLCHRLDKCTSGVIIFGKNKEVPTKFHENNEKFVTKKMYYARVGGNFNQELWGEVDMPIVCLDHKNGVHAVYEVEKHKELEAYNKDPRKESVTEFKKLWYDAESDSSLLECYPKTGRTHQIRVHLQYTGHSILNDTVYGGRFVGNNVLRKYFEPGVYEKFMKENAEMVGKRGDREMKSAKEKVEEKEEIKQSSEAKEIPLDTYQKRMHHSPQEQQTERKNSKKKVMLEREPMEGHSLNSDQWDYTNRAMEICLHSYKYTLEGVQYTTDKPYWYQKSLLPTYSPGKQLEKQSIKQEKEQPIDSEQITQKVET